MKAIVCESFGPVERLRLRKAVDPTPGQGEVVIDVSAAGVNYPDVLMVQGRYQTRPDLPFTPGCEASGRVRSVGDGVINLARGDRVVAFTRSGAFAEQVTAPATQVYRLPPRVDLHVAGGVLIAYGTAYHALKDRAALRPGETLLVLGAGGGVGLAAVELGKRIGARVIAAASSADKLALARDRGADSEIDYAREDLHDRVKALTDGRGVDVAYDPVGGPASLAAVKSLALGGRHLIVGFASGDIPAIPANRLLLKSAACIGVLWGMSLRADPQHHARNIAQVLAWIDAGALRPAVERTYPLAQAAAALQHVESRRARGKVLLGVA